MVQDPLLPIAAIGLMALVGCAGRPGLPTDEGPIDPFIVERDLSGKTVGRGVFSAINGQKRGFTAHLTGTWDGETFTLAEDFVFDDGETDTKTWVLKKVGEGRYEGAREDTVGTAIGFQDGDVFRLEYFMRVGGETGRKLKFRDIMYKRADGVVVNKARVGYWGLNVGRVELEIRPVAGQGALSQQAAE